jgi:hypothetical protein
MNMIIKNSAEYDSILHAGADMEFIDGVFKVNPNDLSNAKIQLLEQYTKEYEENLRKSKTAREENLASLLHNRNLSLIEREYMAFRIREIDKKAISDSSTGGLSSNDAIDRAECVCSYAENDLNQSQRNMRLLRVASSTESIIWEQERPIDEYQIELEDKYSPLEVSNDSYLQGQIPLIEDLKRQLEMAQIQLTDTQRYAQEQKSDGFAR